MKRIPLTMVCALVTLLAVALLAPRTMALDKKVQEAAAAGNWDRVVELVGPTLRFGPDISARYLMIQACRASNRNNTAEQQLDVDPTPADRIAWLKWNDSLIAAYPESPAARALWADARYKARRDTSYQDKAVSLSLASASRAIDLDPKFAFAYKIRGDIYLLEHRSDHAISDYKKAIELDSNLIEAQFDLGVALEQQENYDKAIQQYSRVIKMNPNFAKALTFRAAVYRQKDNINQAIEDCNAALQADSTYAMAQFVKGMAYYQAKMSELATKAFKDFIAIAPPKMARYARNAQARVTLMEEEKASD